MVVFGIIVFLIAWDCLVLRSEKIHNIQYFDEYYFDDTPLAFKDTIKEHRRMQNDIKKLKRKHKINTNNG